jgi:hypothetical protein
VLVRLLICLRCEDGVGGEVNETDEQGLPNMPIQMGHRSTYIHANTSEKKRSR